jgi:Kef-type K+ transport system membrane component KefB
MELFGAVGLIYLMFNAGLEIDLDQFRAFRHRALIFAAASYLLPQAAGILIGRLFGLGWAASVLLGAAFASQTLVAYSVLRELGILRNKAIAITVGATIFTDIVSLLVLAVIEGVHGDSFSLFFLGRLVLFTLVYAGIILWGVPRLGRLFFRAFSGNVVEFQFMLLVLFVAAVAAKWIGMHTIVGAFLAGLALNNTLAKDSRAVQQVLFTGESLFVPLFMITVGMRLDVVSVFTNTQALLIGAALTLAVVVTKLVAAGIVGAIFGYERNEVLTSWGLSQAQAAATLAMILVGTQEGLFPSYVFSGAILVILVTSISSPFLVERFGRSLEPPPEEEKERPRLKRILVPVLGDEAPEPVLSLAARLTRRNEGTLLVLNLTRDEEGMKKRRDALRSGPLKDPDTEIELLNRIDAVTAKNLRNASLESEASMIFMPWPEEKDVANGRLLGEMVDDVVWDAKVPVGVAALHTPINALERVLVVIGAHTVGVKLDDSFVDVAVEIGEALDLPLVVMATDHYLEALQKRFGDTTGNENNDENEDGTKMVRLGAEIVGAVAQEAQEHDLIIIPTMSSQARLEAKGERVPFAVWQETDSSLLLLHFP